MPLLFLPKFLRDQLSEFRFRIRGCFPYFGTSVYGPRQNSLYSRLRQQGVYERETCNYIINAVKEGTWYIDVGANLGLMSIPVLAERPGVNVLSIEPSPSSYPYLKQTREKSRHAKRWQTLSKAVSGVNGTVPFVLAVEGNGAFEGLKDTGRVAIAQTIEVETAPLDAIWKSLDRPAVSVIKIDVEGAESQVLESARELLQTCRPVVVLEWALPNLHAYHTQVNWILEFSKAAGYACCDLTTLAPVQNAEHLEHLSAQGRENFVLYPLAKQNTNG